MKVVGGTMESLCTTKLPQGLDKHNMSPSSTYTRPTHILEPSTPEGATRRYSPRAVIHAHNQFFCDKEPGKCLSSLTSNSLIFVCL